MGNSSISLAQRAVPLPLHRSNTSGNPPMPSNRLPIVTGRKYCALMRFAKKSQNGKAMELPSAL